MTPFARSAISVSLIVCGVAAGRPPAAAIPEESINRAVERGAAALRKFQAADGSFAGTTYGSGPTALAALALLECGASLTDDQVRKAVAVVHADCPAMNRTYSLGLAIMLLDRIGDPLDEPIIHVMTVRLLEGQTAAGGWGYTNGDVLPEEAAKLRTLMERRELKTVPSGSAPAGRPPVDQEIIDRLKRLEQRRLPAKDSAQSDNSNTQFAILGIWVGRRHGIPTDTALRRADLYFRATHEGGRWPYIGYPKTQVDERPANTCSGLLGLATGAGVVREAQLRTHSERKDGKPPALRDPLKDPLVQVAMNYVGAEVAQVAAAGLNADINNNYRGLYFLWSVERVGMIYSVPVMGGVDWYQVGAATILRGQQPDGAWSAHGMGNVTVSGEFNTCFALLFLRKSNFANDLTANLRNKLKQTTIRAGDDKGDMMPQAAAEASEAERLARALPGATPERQDAILGELRDGKGTEFTEALARVIPKVDGAAQKKARDALAERLARMAAVTIRAKLKDDNAEVRRASTLACAMKDDNKGFIPDLIATLDDKDNWVVRGAAVALRTITGQDFGPSASATTDERAKSIAAWKAWWKRQNGR
jgi:hypothetical protein